MIYFDNAATTFPKPASVIRDLEFCLKKYCANSGRSSHSLSIRTSEEIYNTREKVAKLFSLNTPECVVFTHNATHALNLAIKSFIQGPCHIITSDIEHNSVIRPLEKLKRMVGIEYSTFDSDKDVNKVIEELIRADTIGIVSSIASNVTGKNIDIASLSNIARKYGLFLIIDASQAVGHIEIDLYDNPCDVLCAPAHKALFGIQGLGIAVFKDNKRRETLLEGGSGYDSANLEMPLLLPEGYEAGTLPTPAIVALGSGIDFINKIEIQNIKVKLNKLTDLACERLSNIKGIELYHSGNGIVSFNYKQLPSHVISTELSKYGVCTRDGLHCAPSIHKKLGTLDRGAVRLSFSCLNKEKEIDRFYNLTKSILSKY